MPISVVPFAADHIPDAAALLARRHAAQRKVEPLLDPQYERTEVCARDLVTLLDEPDASGAAVVSTSGVTAYVLGAPRESSWGAHAWVTAAGHAASDPENLRDAYARAAQRWYDEGRTSHYVLTPAHDAAAVAAWYRLGFGQMHAHAVRESAPLTPHVAGAVLRVPTRGDLDQIVDLERLLPDHQARSPVFSTGPRPTDAELRADWQVDLVDPRLHHLVIDRAGELVGLATGCAASVSSAHRGISGVPGAGLLGHAAVAPSGRGQGYGRALAEAIIDWSFQQGYPGVANDWRVTNLLASRSWPRLGWRTTFLRLHRTIGPAG